MTRSYFSFATAVFLAAGSFTQAGAVTEFHGGGVVGNYSGCEAYGYLPTDGSALVGRYRPGGLPGNSPTNDTISLSYNTYAFHLTIPSGWSYGTPVQVTWFAVVGGGGVAPIPASGARPNALKAPSMPAA